MIDHRPCVLSFHGLGELFSDLPCAVRVSVIGKLPRVVHDNDQDEDDQDHAGKESWHSSLRHLLMMMIMTMQKWYRLLEYFIV